MKANFRVDSDFPVIDGVGHSDKIGYLNVKGGGSTNTTLYDPSVPSSHYLTSWRVRSAVSPPTSADNFTPCAVDPTHTIGGLLNPGALNVISEGDAIYSRCSSKVVLNRIVVSGSVTRAGGHAFYANAVGDAAIGRVSYDPSAVLISDPKCFVALVLDKSSNSAAFDADQVFDGSGGIHVPPTTCSLPWLDENWVSRYSVLAFDILDWSDRPGVPVLGVGTVDTTGVGVDVTQISGLNIIYQPSTKGFLFDVDLNGVLCSFESNVGDYNDLSDVSLHMVAVWFDGYMVEGTAIPSYNNLGIEYQSKLFFEDFLSPSAFVAAGADGPVVPDDEVPLAILADQSAAMAGDGTFLDPPAKRRHTKASTGHFNFRPKNDPAIDNFDDDPEFSVARRGLRKYESRSRAVPIVQRRSKAHKYDDNEDFLAREGDRGGKRGKY